MDQGSTLRAEEDREIEIEIEIEMRRRGEKGRNEQTSNFVEPSSCNICKVNFCDTATSA